MAMLWLLNFFWKGPVSAAHLQHGFRKETAIRDAAFVERICSEWGIPCEVEHRDVPSLKRSGESLEEAGRRERYLFLCDVADKRKAQFVATGHTADDSAETVFLNLLRGTGIRGIRGIPETRGNIIRPVIGCSRMELQGFLSLRSVPWVTDESNEDIGYFRNRVRHVFFPLLEKQGNPRLRDHLLSLASDASRVERSLGTQTCSTSSWCSIDYPFTVKAWRLKLLRKLDSISLHSLFAEAGRDLGLSALSRKKFDSLSALIEKGIIPWRFQWENSIEVCGSQSMAAVIDRDIFKEGVIEEKEVNLAGSEGEFEWGHWCFEWHLANSRAPLSGDMTAIIPVGTSGSIRVANLEKTLPSRRTPVKVPWWCRNSWPVIDSGCSRWVPLEGFLPQETDNSGIGSCFRIKAFFSSREFKGDLRDGF